MVTKKIETLVGHIHGRDAIHCDSCEFVIERGKLILKGDINNLNCSKSKKSTDWIAFALIFLKIKHFSCVQRDLTDLEIHTESCFDEVVESNLIENLGLFDQDVTHYIVSTYDHIFQVVAGHCEFHIP